MGRKKKDVKLQRTLVKSATFGPAYQIDDKLFWDPVPKMSSTIPWGYMQDPDDPEILLPNNEDLRNMEVAKKLLKTYSLRDVAAWLSEETGKSISHISLHQRVRYEKERGKKARSLRHYAEKAQDALRKAQKAEKLARRLQAAGRCDSTPDGEEVPRRFYEDLRDYCEKCGAEYHLPTERGTSD